MKRKRMIIMSDLHCGHRAGLTPPDWWFQKNTEHIIFNPKNRSRWAQQQRAMWQWYTKTLDRLRQEKAFDICVVNGDAIDGTGSRSGGTELITTDREEQIEMAEQCIRKVGAAKHVLTYGTPYHTGQEEDFETILARRLQADISGQMFIEVNGIKFDIKHKVGGSSVPYGRHTAISREKLWNLIWADKGLQPNCDVYIRGHVHFFAANEDTLGLGIILPALQGFGSKYGVRQCSGTVDIGFVYFDFYEDGSWQWQKEIAKLKCQAEQCLKL